MLSINDLKEYRERKGVSIREVAEHCDVTHQLISDIENGKKNLTEFNYKEIVSGINKAIYTKFHNQAKTKDVVPSKEDNKKVVKTDNKKSETEKKVEVTED